MDDLIVKKTELIEYAESSIDTDLPLYLITWSPDPKQLPDADFYIQHNFNVNTVSDYLKYCLCGIFCVESSQIGNPHYHGWYQIDSSKELGRIAIVKTMQRFGNLKISKARSYRIFSFKKHANCLYYYKKDLVDSFLTIDPNPITRNSESTLNLFNLDLISFLTCKSMTNIQDRMSDVNFYRQFYDNTLDTIK